jgi:hypothetical protein
MAALAAVNPQIAEIVAEIMQIGRGSMSHGASVMRRE